MLVAKVRPDQTLLDHDNHSVILIDHQPRFGVEAQPSYADPLRANVFMVTKACKVPILVTTIANQPDKELDGQKSWLFTDSVSDGSNSKPRLDEWIVQWATTSEMPIVVLTGLRTSVSIFDAAMLALDQGLMVYVIADACGDTSEEAHQLALKHMRQQGAHTITSLQYLLELR